MALGVCVCAPATSLSIFGCEKQADRAMAVVQFTLHYSHLAGAGVAIVAASIEGLEIAICHT